MEEIILDKDCYPKLFRILRSKFPLLGKNEVADLIDKTRENNGGTLSGLKVVEVFTSVENTLTERQNNKNQKSKDERTCKVCYKLFTYKKTCVRHMKNEHGNLNAAGERMNKKDNSNQTKKHFQNNDHTCKICNKTYTLVQNMKRHMRTHQEEVITFKCKFCDKSYNRKDRLVRHEQRIHLSYKINFSAAGSQSSLKCHICSLDFEDDKERLFAHLSSKICESNNKFSLDKDHRFECDYCDKTYQNRDSLMKHISWKHSNKSVKINCNLCTSTFQYKSTLVRHLKEIHGVS